MPPDVPPKSVPSAQPSPKAGRIRAAAGWLLFLVPLAYLDVVMWLQPPDRLGDSAKAPWLVRLLFDDFDWTAIALRGLNANLGRQAGRPDDPCHNRTWRQFHEELRNPPPLRERYFLEYPQSALALFRCGYWLQPGSADVEVPTAVADACHLHIVWYTPRSDAEHRLWQRFRRVIQTYETLMIVCLLALMVVLWAGYESGRRLGGPLALLLLPGALYFTLNRFDIVPALLMALSLACLGRKRMVASACLLGAATMVKVYPVLMAPLVVRYLMANRRRALVWAVAFGATVAVLMVLPLVQTDWTAIWGPYKFQLSRPLETGFTIYGHGLPRVLGTPAWSIYRLGGVLLTLAVLLWQRPPDLAGLLRRSAVVLVVFVALQVFYSPQWLLWFSPLLIPLARRQRAILVLVILLDLITYLTFPVAYDQVAIIYEQFGNLAQDEQLQGLVIHVLVYARFATLAALVVTLLWGEFGRQAA